MTANELEPLAPNEARQLYIQDRTDFAENTKFTHNKRLAWFCDWYDKEDIENLNNLTGRDISRYKIEAFSEKENGDDYSDETIRGYIDTLRVYLRFCASIDGVLSSLPEKAQSPRPNKSRDEELEADRAETILKHLAKYEYASVRHALTLLVWRTGTRTGTLRALDVDDIDRERRMLKIRHRPDGETPLKNKYDGERRIAISARTLEVVQDYISQNSPDVLDEHGRTPLFASKQGRRSRANIREIIYSATRPCELTNECPHGKDVDDWDAARQMQYASKCPSTVSPHPVRRGSISHMLREGVSKAVVSDRCNVEPSTLDEHYNTLDETERADRGRTYFEDELTDY